MIDPWKQRTLDALSAVATVYDLRGDVEQLKGSNVWLPQATMMLAECLAAILDELPATGQKPGQYLKPPRSLSSKPATVSIAPKPRRQRLKKAG